MNSKINRLIVFYVAINIAVVSLTVFSDMLLIAYKKYDFSIISTYALYSFLTIAISALSYVKIIMQSRVTINISRFVNIVILMIFIFAISVFYHPLSFASFTTTFILATIVFYLQLCSLVYDFFFRKK